MSDTRDSLSKLISELQKTQSLWDQLRPTTFERVVAELAAQSNSILELQRSTGADLFLRLRDEAGSLRTIAMEVKQLQHALGPRQVEQLGNLVSQLNADRGLLITSSYFTDEAVSLARQYENMRLVDRSGLQSWVNEYVRGRDQFLNQLFVRVGELSVLPTVEFDDPSAEQIDAIDPADTGLAQEQSNALLSVDALPLRLVARILRTPSDLRNLSPRQFEEFVAETVEELGFTDVILTPRSRDGGKDVIASHKINGIPLAFYFECKHYAEDNKVQLETLRALLGTLAHDARSVNKGVLVTTSTFTQGARKFILGESRLDGKDYDGVLGWVDEIRRKIDPD